MDSEDSINLKSKIEMENWWSKRIFNEWYPWCTLSENHVSWSTADEISEPLQLHKTQLTTANGVKSGTLHSKREASNLVHREGLAEKHFELCYLVQISSEVKRLVKKQVTFQGGHSIFLIGLPCSYIWKKVAFLANFCTAVNLDNKIAPNSTSNFLLRKVKIIIDQKFYRKWVKNNNSSIKESVSHSLNKWKDVSWETH